MNYYLCIIVAALFVLAVLVWAAVAWGFWAAVLTWALFMVVGRLVFRWVMRIAKQAHQHEH